MSKKLYVGSPVQVAMLKEIIIPEMCDGIWKDERPANHGQQWLDVELLVSENGQVGPVDFKIPRPYNFIGPAFLEKQEEALTALVKRFEPKALRKHVRKYLIQLSQIVGGRLTDLTEAPVKAYRGNNVPDTRSNTDVLTSGKGLGSVTWLAAVESIIERCGQLGIKHTTNHVHVHFERGARQIRLSLNGAGALDVEFVGGDRIVTITSPTEANVVINRVILAMTNVNGQVIQKDDDGVVTTVTSSGAVVRRRPATKIKVNPKLLAMSNPFGL